MTNLKNESGSVFVFATLMLVLLMIMVGMGLDTGWLTYGRSQGQRAVDAAALAGAAGVAMGDAASVKDKIEALNTTNNDYIKSLSNPIDGTIGGKNVMLITYDPISGDINPAGSMATANGVRVALEQQNPYTKASTASAMNAPLFLMPLLNLFGSTTSSTANVNVSAVAAIEAIPSLPLALGGCQYGNDQQVPFNQTPSGGSNPNDSGFTTYWDQSTSVPDLVALIRGIVNCQGTGGVKVGDPICLGNGGDTPVVREFNRLADESGATCYLAPVVDPIKNFTGCDMTIQAFANVCIKAICAPGIPKSTLCTTPPGPGNMYIVANVKSCNVDLDAPNVSQCYTTRLVRDKLSGM